MDESNIIDDNRVKRLQERYNRLARNGKNLDSQGVLKRIERTINKAKRGIALA